jgi:NADPH-dependent ferric siderophore reductase
MPAISQLLEVLPPQATVHVLIEVADPSAQLELPAHPKITVDWCAPTPDAPPGDALVEAVRNASLADGERVWAAGEAAAVQRIRRHLFEERGLTRADATVRGYWKHGRAAADDD